MLKRDAMGAARMLERDGSTAFPGDTEINVIRVKDSGEWGVQIKLEGREANYTNLEDLHKFLREYLDKLQYIDELAAKGEL